MQAPSVSVVPSQLEALQPPPVISWVHVAPSARSFVQSPAPVATVKTPAPAAHAAPSPVHSDSSPTVVVVSAAVHVPAPSQATRVVDVGASPPAQVPTRPDASHCADTKPTVADRITAPRRTDDGFMAPALLWMRSSVAVLSFERCSAP
jgi:hypothetical protein